ncbi:sigma-70 family RNA polymerase sigma factor [soil metagenome]
MGRLVPLRRVSGEMTELSVEALLAACGIGDRAALGALFDRFHADVYRLVSRLPGVDVMASDDIVQATFLRLPSTAAQFAGRSTVKTWILGIASNIARHHARSEQRRRGPQEVFAAARPVLAEQPDSHLERRQLLAGIADVLATLPHDQQVAFILCDVEQIPGVEVARIFDIPAGTLWRRLHGARKALRTELAKRRA